VKRRKNGRTSVPACEIGSTSVLDREFNEGSFDYSVFAKHYQRLLSTDTAKRFFADIYKLPRQQGWTRDEHFSADGTLIESQTSFKSFVRKDGADAAKARAAKDEDPDNPEIHFRGDTRRNDTHRSRTDLQPAAKERDPVLALTC
jgi:hypothetical protein